MKARDFLGPYRLARLIRIGNSCSVWEAIKSGDDQRYALKVLRTDQIGNKDEEGFLKHEFDVSRGFKHPGVIKIYELRNDASVPYLVLELFSEHNMKQALRQGPEKLAFYAKGIIEQTAEALYHVNSTGWVHCDIKPDNILVSRTGEVKLIDFTIAQKMKKGLAKLFNFGSKNVRGTRSYMSPEQIRNKPLDQRADVYSFGCVMFELLSGKVPFTASAPNELLEKHLRAPIPSIQVHNANVSDEVSMLIRACMAKKPEDRPETMWELVRQFRTHRLFKKAPKKIDHLDLPEVAVNEEDDG